MSSNGKGSKPRPFDRKAWDEGYDRAFRSAQKETKKQRTKKQKESNVK